MSQRENRKNRHSTEYITISVTIPCGLLRQFDEERKRRGYSRSELIRKGIRRQLEIWTGKQL